MINNKTKADRYDEICQFLDILISIWYQNSELRFMQLILNAVGVYETYDTFTDEVKDHYNTTDAVVLQGLKALYG